MVNLQFMLGGMPPVNQKMYGSLYMTDYIPHPEDQLMDDSKRMKLEAQLKSKEFGRRVEKKPMRYSEDPKCQEIQPPYPLGIVGPLPKAQGPLLSLQEVPGDQRVIFLPAEPITDQEKGAERTAQPTDVCAIPDNTGTPCIKQELGQNWNNYQQFVLDMRRANQSQLKEIKKSQLGSSVFQADFISGTDPSTYQRDFKNWPRVRSGHYQVNRNFSNFIFHDGYYSEDPWMSEYMDNYSIFLRKLNWNTQSPMSSFCSAVKPIPHLSPGISAQTPIAVNTAL